MFTPPYSSNVADVCRRAWNSYNTDGTEKKEKVEVEQTSIGFKKVYVFDVSQTSGEPIPQYVHELNEVVEDEHVEAVINAVHDITGIPVDFENISSGAKGYYSYGEQRIVIQENLSGAQAVKTAIHECAHALLHDPYIDNSSFELQQYDDVLVRKVVECVKILSKEEISVTFKGGYEIKSELLI